MHFWTDGDWREERTGEETQKAFIIKQLVTPQHASMRNTKEDSVVTISFQNQLS